MRLCAFSSRTLFLAALLVALALPSHANTVIASYVPGELIVRLKPGGEAAFGKSARAGGLAVAVGLEQIGYRRVKLPPGLTVEQAIEKFKADPAVDYVGPNHLIHITTAQVWPNDPVFSDGYDLLDFGIFIMPPQWGLYNDGINQDMYGGTFPGKPRADIHAPEAWAITTGDPNLVIASIDTGVDNTHPDLSGKVILPGYNALDKSSNAMDDNGHGTFTSAIMAAKTNNNEGVAGVTWGCKILPVKIIGADGSGTEADGADGTLWAVNHGAKVLNMSFATDIDAPALRSAVDYAYANNRLCVAASGNENASTPMYPAAYPHALSVGATNPYDKRCTASDWGSGGSNYGSYLDVVAPGNQITSAYTDPDLGQLYLASDGTSAAAPFVSGVAALVFSIHPTWTPQQVMDQIMRTADDVETPGLDQFTGWGRVNAYRALTETIQQGPTPYIGTLYQKPDGFYVEMTGKVVTAGTGQIANKAYIEESDRSCGIMLNYPSGVPFGFAAGSRVSVAGTLATVNGERSIAGPVLTKLSNGTALRPLGITNRLAARPTTGMPKGLLVKVWGHVTAIGFDYIYIDDGTYLDDGSGFQGLRISIPSPSASWDGKMVSVIGALGMDLPTGAPSPLAVVRPRSPVDVRVLN